MFGRLFNRNPYRWPRAEKLIVSFLKQHRRQVISTVFARRIVGNIEAGGMTASLDGLGPKAQAEVGGYEYYAVPLALYASVLCSGSQAGPPDSGEIFVRTSTILSLALDLPLETAGQLVGDVGEFQRKAGALDEDGTPLTDEEIAELPEDRRAVAWLNRIANIDAVAVMTAFLEAGPTIDLSDHDVDPVANLLDLAFHPDPESEKYTSKIKWDVD